MANRNFSDARTSLETVRYVELDGHATADATGTATVDFGDVPSGMLWRVELLTVSTTPADELKALGAAAAVKQEVQGKDERGEEPA